MLYNLIRPQRSANQRGTRGKSPWARQTRRFRATFVMMPEDAWATEEAAERAQFLRQAKGNHRIQALAALRVLAARYKLRLPLVEARWGFASHQLSVFSDQSAGLVTGN